MLTRKTTTAKKTSIKEAANAKPKTVEIKPALTKSTATVKKEITAKPKIVSLKDVNFADFKANK